MATAEATAAGHINPPYVPFETLKGFVDSLHETVVPTHIDRGMMGGMSGATQSHLLVALRFLGLVRGKSDEATDELHALVAAYGTERWKQTLEATLKAAYAPIVGQIDVTKASDKILRDAFRNVGKVDGTMLDRAVRFYTKGLKEAGVEVSPHVGKRKARGSGPRRSASVGRPDRQRENGQAGSGAADSSKPAAESTQQPTPPGMIDFPIPMGSQSGLIRVRADITPADLAVVEAILSVVKAMADRNAAAAQK